MPAANCPPNDQLSAFLVGQLNEADIEFVADHLETCPVCRDTVETLEMKEHTLVAQLRVPAATQPLPISAACERAMAAAEKLLDDSSRSAITEATLVKPGVIRIRDYRIVEKLGEGGMGAVYKAIHERLERIVAIKVLTPDRLRDPKGVSRFQREMKAVGKLQHPNIVNAHDAGEADGTHFLVMEYVDGVDLGELVTRVGPLSIPDACELIRQAALGLEQVHEHDLVHRDIKPSNLMLTRTGQVKILDLGLALLHDPQQPVGSELTGTRQLMGTADYISPEQAENTHSVDIRADLYSLGCTLYKLLTGHAPFSGKEYDNPLIKIVAHMQRTPPAIASQRAGVPAGLAALIDKLLAKKPANRYATPAEVAAALAPFTAGCDAARLAARAASHSAAGKVRGTGALRPHAATAASKPKRTTKLSLSSALAETDGGTKVKPRTTRGKKTTRGKWWRDARWQTAAGGLAAMLVVLGIVISIQTPAGTIVLKMDQGAIAGAEVTVDDQKKLTIRTGVGEESIEVTADEKTHQLKVVKGGFETFTHEFTARKGKNDPIAVWLEPSNKKVAVAGTKSPSDKSGWTADAPPPAIAPFDADAAKSHQEAWAAYLNVPVEYENSIGMKFRLIPPGEFMMGSTPAEIEHELKFEAADKHWQECIKSEAPRHKVILTQPIYLGIHEVTQRQYARVMGNNPSHFALTGAGKDSVAGTDTTNFPVESVSWYNAGEFCTKLSRQEQLKPFDLWSGETVTPLDGTGYRLPMEAEWEFACRAGTTTKYWIGDQDEDLPQAGWFFRSDSGGRIHAVGELKANPFGLFDVHGNVWEWLQDRWEPTYYRQFQEKPAHDPTGPSSAGPHRVIRGGTWGTSASHCLASSRHAGIPESRYFALGFRVALIVDTARKLVKSTAQPVAPVKFD